MPHLDPSYIQIGAAIGVIYVVGRWALSSKNPQLPERERPRRTVPQQQVDTILATFPQITENQARWDLGRSGSLETTVERILRDGRLPDPPPNLFPPSGDTRQPANTGNTAPKKPSTDIPNLITKYNLQSRIEETDDVKGKGKEREVAAPSKWAVNTGDRETDLKERKARMILGARKKLLDKDMPQL